VDLGRRLATNSPILTMSQLRSKGDEGQHALINRYRELTAHATKWTVVVDRPRAVPALPLFDTQVEANAEIIRLQERGVAHLFALPPVALGSLDQPSAHSLTPLGSVIEEFDVRALSGYTDLEWDAASRSRGDRDLALQRQLRLLTGAEAALVVNNCASAIFLALNTLGAGKEVLVSTLRLYFAGRSADVPL
jgi:hypothetical protein